MKKLVVISSVLLLVPMLLPARIYNTKYADRVDPFIGTDFHGHTFPGAAYPFGMVQLSPDTREDNWDGCSGYHYSDSMIKGFSHTHLSGTGCADLCDIRVMPVVDFEGPVAEENYQSPFMHSRESASAGYYRVHLDRWDVDAELTVGRRMGAHRYTYPKEAVPQLVIDLGPRDQLLSSKLEQAGEYAVRGYRKSRSWADDQVVYFYMEFSKPITDARIENGPSGATAILTFGKTSGLSRPRELLVNVGISSVSTVNARANLESEGTWKKNGLFAFDLLRKATALAWNDYLSKIEVQGDEKTMQIFYTALYHTAIAPSLYSDVNGEYRGMDRKVHVAKDFDRYHIFSLWDTYRTLHPLLNIIERKRTVDFIKSMLSIYDEAGKLPRWELSGYETDCMIGYSAAPVIADALARGIDGFDVKKALKALETTANLEEYGIGVYRDNGLVLADKEHESVSKTLEYALDDWCISRVARYLNDRKAETEYLKRSKYWSNVYDPTTGFMRPRVNGMWLEPFNPSDVNVHYTEANAWQYSFHVQHDLNGLIDACGGDTSMEEWLDDLFGASSETGGSWKVADMTGMIGQYAQGNEPSHHIAYIYSYVGVPWKTQRMVRRIMEELFTTGPDGLCGNEDCGQMSAWYVMSAMGFYPVTPGNDQYVFGSPMFRSVIIHQENGKDFTIRAPRNSHDNRYISRVIRDGKPYTRSWFPYEDLAQGSTFILEMDKNPNRKFGADEDDRPVSRCERAIVENPWFKVSQPLFTAYTRVEIEAADKDYRIMYQIVPEDGPVTNHFDVYKRPFTVSRNSTVYAYCVDKEGHRSFKSQTRLRHVDNTYQVKLHYPFNPNYTGGGERAIVDGVRGETNFRLGGWQGYQTDEFAADIDLGQKKYIYGMSAGFLQDTRSWIILPQWVEFYTSDDGEHFVSQGRVSHHVDPRDETPRVEEFSLSFQAEAQYVRVVAKNFGKLPDWHPGFGGQAHIFVDEVTIR